MFYRIAKTEKGTITHDDWKKLSFSLSHVANGILAQVTGEEADCSAWAERVKGTEVKEADALAEIKTATLAGLSAEKSQKQSEIAAIDVKVASLSAV